MPELNEYDAVLSEVDRWCGYFFTVEYFLRLWSCVEEPRFTHPWRDRLRFMFSGMGIIDLLALAPFYQSAQ